MSFSQSVIILKRFLYFWCRQVVTNFDHFRGKVSPVTVLIALDITSVFNYEFNAILNKVCYIYITFYLFLIVIVGTLS